MPISTIELFQRQKMKTIIDTEGRLNKPNITANTDLLPNNQNIHVTHSKKNNGYVSIL